MEPTPTELVRRLEEAVAAIRDLTNKLEQGYVRKDVWEAEQRSVNRQTAAIEVNLVKLEREADERAKRHQDEKAEKERADTAFRRQVAVAGIVAGVGWLVTIVIAVINFVGR